VFCVMIKKTPIKKIWKKHQERIANWWSEKATFKIKYYRNLWKTDLTWKFVAFDHAASYMFAHALPKGTYPEFRNNVNNIVFVDDIDQHEWVDKQVARHKFIVIDLVKKWLLIPRLKEKWEDFLIQKKQWNIH